MSAHSFFIVEGNFIEKSIQKNSTPKENDATLSLATGSASSSFMEDVVERNKDLESELCISFIDRVSRSIECVIKELAENPIQVLMFCIDRFMYIESCSFIIKAKVFDKSEMELTLRNLSSTPLVSKVSLPCSSIVTAASFAKVTPEQKGCPGLLQNIKKKKKNIIIQVFVK